MQALETFIDQWNRDENGIKPVFLSLYQDIRKQEQVEIDFVQRPGVSYSVRGRHRSQSERPLFVMLDVIDDEPGQRWLSVCFYGDMIEDPDELGDFVPGGLLGSDGHCFDITEPDDAVRAYVGRCLQQAYKNARDAAN